MDDGMLAGLNIVSGGQTGADRAALDWAIDLSIRTTVVRQMQAGPRGEGLDALLLASATGKSGAWQAVCFVSGGRFPSPEGNWLNISGSGASN
jgi:hypothetical protein